MVVAAAVVPSVYHSVVVVVKQEVGIVAKTDLHLDFLHIVVGWSFVWACVRHASADVVDSAGRPACGNRRSYSVHNQYLHALPSDFVDRVGSVAFASVVVPSFVGSTSAASPDNREASASAMAASCT